MLTDTIRKQSMQLHKTGAVKITISYGYDIHSIVVSRRTFDRIEHGAKIKIKGQGFPTDDGIVPDHWIFNGEPRIVVYCDDGRDLYREDSWPFVESVA
jgi:hypothetical protein